MKFVWLFKKDGVTLKDRVFSDIEESEVQHLYVQTAEEIEDETTHEISYRNVDTDIIYYVSRIVGNETVWDEFSLGYEDVSNPCISGNLPDGITMRKIGLGLFEIHGTLPIINDETSYYFTLRARYNDNGENVETDQYFEILVENKTTEFDPNQEPLFSFTETLYSSNKIQLINPEGNESFIKVAGELPVGITLSEQGDLYGIASEEEETSRIYNFTIGVKRDGEIILEKIFQATVLKLSTLSEPIWITESGNLGSINYNENSEQFLVKAYDPNNLEITYELGQTGILPPGLNVEKYTGRIIGKCKTLHSRDWDFDIIASNEAYKVSRAFTISTNTVMKEDEIRWSDDYESNVIGDFKIGESVFFNVKAISNKAITYSLLSDTLPKGLTFDSKGSISGVIDFQNTGDYKFVVSATNGVVEITNTFIIRVSRGLGYNSLNCFLYINHEYDDEYTSMLGYFDRSYAYQATNPLYKVKSNPEIDICKCTCYDRTLMNHLLIFNHPLKIYWKNTASKKYIKDGVEMFQAFYKEIQEENSEGGVVSYHGNKVYVEANKESPTGYYLFGTKTPVKPNSAVYTESNLPIEGLEYIIYNYRKTYIVTLSSERYYENESKKVISYEEPRYTEEYSVRNPYTYEWETKQREYILRNDDKVYVTQCSNGMLMDASNDTYLGINRDDVEIFRDDDIVKQYFIDTDSAYSIAVPSTSKIREQLSTPIYVDKNNNMVLYDVGSQEIISENEDLPEYILKYDDKRGEYYAEYNGKQIFMDVYATSNEIGDPVPVYAKVENDGWIAKADNMDASQETFDNVYDAKNARRNDYKYILDGNMTKYRLVPVKVQVVYLNTDVNYKQYFVYDKDSGTLQEDILFTLDWDKTVKFVIKGGKVHHVKTIDKPWVYNPSKNESVGYDKKIVLPYIQDTDVLNISSKPFIKFFDDTLESLPVWKTVTIPEWTPNTNYKANDIFWAVIKNASSEATKYYRVIEDYKSSNEFDATLPYIQEIVNTETSQDLDKLLSPYYFPTLDLFYGVPNSSQDGYNLLRNNENKGAYWTNRNFDFFEVHFEPLYNKNIDNFSIDFYNHNNKNTPEFRLV